MLAFSTVQVARGPGSYRLAKLRNRRLHREEQTELCRNLIDMILDDTVMALVVEERNVGLGEGFQYDSDWGQPSSNRIGSRGLPDKAVSTSLVHLPRV